MNSLRNNQRYYHLSSLYTAAFLFAKDQTLVGIDKTTDPKRAQFTFLFSPELESLLQSFNFAKDNTPEILVDSRKFITAIKTLKEKLYQEDYGNNS